MHVRVQDSVLWLHAPAKINLFLEVLGRRDDGFHELETVMAAVSIFDTLSFSATSNGRIDFACHWASGIEAQRLSRGAVVGSAWEALPEGTDNIVVKALERLRYHVGSRQGAVVRLFKRIPAAAGLGGASSDAAAALLAANRAWQLNWPLPRLRQVAAEIGSDVPFFLHGGTAVCRGRGERIEPVRRFPTLSLVIVRPPIGLSTPAVFRQCRPPTDPLSSAELLAAGQSGNHGRLSAAVFNRLRPAAESLSPWVGRLRDAFAGCGAIAHEMTGSGSCYFAVCRNHRHAGVLARRLRAMRLGAVYRATTLPPNATL